MNRRNFFKLGMAAVAGIVLNEAIPLGRVWSFPSKIVIPDTWSQVNAAILDYIRKSIPHDFVEDGPLIEALKQRGPFHGGRFIQEPFIYAPTPPKDQQVIWYGTNG